MSGERGHHVLLVEPERLRQQDFAFMEHGGEIWLALRRDRLTAAVLEDCWATYRAMTRTLAVAS